MSKLRTLWKWLTFVGELLCLYLFTNVAYLVPTPNRTTLVVLLIGSSLGAIVFTWFSGKEFQRSGKPAVNNNPPVVIFLVAVAIHMIVALLKFIIFP
jgi:hypothetical protein